MHGTHGSYASNNHAIWHFDIKVRESARFGDICPFIDQFFRRR
jgi:hypothetical protein